MEFSKVKIVTFVPIENADAIRKAIGLARAGKIGEYDSCSFSVIGKGRFISTVKANPYIGKANTLECVDEERIEIICDRTIAKDVIKAVKNTHPYEEVALDIYPLIEESDL
jgi:hypothetical protein